jgi:cell division septation protein DedD
MAVKNRRTLELKIGKLGFVLLVGGMSTLLFGMFLFGVFVGEHLDAWPERYSGGLVDLVRDRLSGLALQDQWQKTERSDETAAKSSGADGDDAFDLTFYSVLGDVGKAGVGGAEGATGKTSRNRDEVSAAVGSGLPAAGVVAASAAAGVAVSGVSHAGQPPSIPDAAKPGSSAQHNPADVRVSGAQAPPILSATDKTLKKPVYQVQAGAYADVKQAEKMVAKLKKIGFAATVVPRDIPNKGRWFRVVVGGFEDRKKAELAVSRIAEKMKGVKCIIRQNKADGA